MPDGLDDIIFVTDLLLERPTCLRCLLERSAIGATRVEAALQAIELTVELLRATDHCRACGTLGIVVFVIRPR